MQEKIKINFEDHNVDYNNLINSTDDSDYENFYLMKNNENSSNQMFLSDREKYYQQSINFEKNIINCIKHKMPCQDYLDLSLSTRNYRNRFILLHELKDKEEIIYLKNLVYEFCQHCPECRKLKYQNRDNLFSSLPYKIKEFILDKEKVKNFNLKYPLHDPYLISGHKSLIKILDHDVHKKFPIKFSITDENGFLPGEQDDLISIDLFSIQDDDALSLKSQNKTNSINDSFHKKNVKNSDKSEKIIIPENPKNLDENSVRTFSKKEEISSKNFEEQENSTRKSHRDREIDFIKFNDIRKMHSIFKISDLKGNNIKYLTQCIDQKKGINYNYFKYKNKEYFFWMSYYINAEFDGMLIAEKDIKLDELIKNYLSKEYRNILQKLYLEEEILKKNSLILKNSIIIIECKFKKQIEKALHQLDRTMYDFRNELKNKHIYFFLFRSNHVRGKLETDKNAEMEPKKIQLFLERYKNLLIFDLDEEFLGYTISKRIVDINSLCIEDLNKDVKDIKKNSSKMFYLIGSIIIFIFVLAFKINSFENKLHSFENKLHSFENKLNEIIEHMKNAKVN